MATQIDNNGFSLTKSDDNEKVIMTMTETDKGFILKYDLNTLPKNFHIGSGGITWTDGTITYNSSLSSISNVSTNISTLQSDVSTIQGDITTINSDITTLQTDVTNLQGDVSTLQTDVTTIQGDITTVESDLSTLSTTVSGFSSAITLLQNETPALQIPSSSNILQVNDTIRLTNGTTSINQSVSNERSCSTLNNRLFQDLKPVSTMTPVDGYYSLDSRTQQIINMRGFNNRIMSNWTAISVGTQDGNVFQNIIWCAELGYYIICSSNGSTRFLKSVNGIGYNGMTYGSYNNTWRCMAYSPELTLAIAVCDTSSGNTAKIIFTSNNQFIGDTIINSNTNVSNGGWTSCCWSPELYQFLAIGYSEITTTPNCVFTPPQPTTFNITTWNPSTTMINGYWTGVCWAAELGLYVACGLEPVNGNRFMTSQDGSVWTIVSGTSSGRGVYITNVNATLSTTITCTSTTGMFVGMGFCCSSGGTWVIPPQTRITGITNATTFTVNNACTFTNATVLVDDMMKSICWSGKLGMLCAVSYSLSGGKVMTSYNGTNWTMRTTPFSSLSGGVESAYYNVIYAGEIGMFVAVGAGASGGNPTNTNIIYSFNGINWFRADQPNTNAIYGVAYSPELGTFRAICSSGSNKNFGSNILGRPPSYINVWDNVSNNMDANGIWSFYAKQIQNAATSGTEGLTLDSGPSASGALKFVTNNNITYTVPGGLITATAGSINQYLTVFVNGQQRKIALYNI